MTIKITPGKSITLAEVPTGAGIFPVLEVVRTAPQIVVHVALDDVHREQMEAALKFFAPDLQVMSFPAWDTVPYDRVSPSHAITSKRLQTLAQLIERADHHIHTPLVVLTTINAITQRVIPRDALRETVKHIRVGDTIARDALSAFLTRNGYSNSSVANDQGEYALRGSIVDIVPVGSEQGYRLDFFGEQLESIRLYDTTTQISGARVERIALYPASEVLRNEEADAQFRSSYRGLFGSGAGKDPLYDAVAEGRHYAGLEQWMPLFYPQLETLFDYTSDATLVLDNMVEESRKEREQTIEEHYTTRVTFSADKGEDATYYAPVPSKQLYIPEAEWQANLAARAVLQLHPYALPEGEGVCAMAFRQGEDFAVMAKHQAQSAFEIFKQRCAQSAAKNVPTIIACVSEGSRTRMAEMLKEYDLTAIPVESMDVSQKQKVSASTVALAILPLDTGFVTPQVMLTTEQDVLGEKIFRRAKRARKAEQFLQELSALQVGELVVHREHGIGRFVGLETLTVAGQAHDLIKLIYAGDDKLFVPVENMELISRYGSDAEDVALDKLGSESWQRRTAALKKRIKYAAEELLRVAAERELHEAQPFHIPEQAYAHFCARFPYAETEDQLQSIEDVLNDLASGKPMDRLVCGDVGFGKTEVALRAAFIAAHPESRATDDAPRGQVAIICPTTLLCRQHYQNFQQRFKDLGFTVRQLSRFVSTKEEKETKAMLEEGEVDIVVGTHALLAESIHFKNLALLIVDEEQRFGVAQKEKLKKLRATTHVLTLTATPIPRTLQLSLSGIRELSLITTPPVDRLAVRTYVMPYDQVMIREAILREHYRGGRTFYVCPRIKDVEELEVKLKQLVPEVKIVTAHGRMPADKLDTIMNQFYDGRYDVLLSTTIVESGLDVPTANTLIVHRADMYGLAQLYQIRGRVGRSKVRAYAYLTLPPHRVLTETAQKRLDVMQRLDNLGAGFMLATHDMDIRGFGNLLGDEQSGTVKEVGVELYQAMLREAVDNARLRERSEQKQEERAGFSPKINIGTSVLIPESYVIDLTLRMSLYRRIAELADEQAIADMRVELIDRFGALPVQVEHLLAVVRIKQLCLLAGIDKIDAGAKGAVISFYKDQFAAPERLLAHIAAHPQYFRIKDGAKLNIISQPWDKIEARIAGLTQQLQALTEIATPAQAA